MRQLVVEVTFRVEGGAVEAKTWDPWQPDASNRVNVELTDRLQRSRTLTLGTTVDLELRRVVVDVRLKIVVVVVKWILRGLYPSKWSKGGRRKINAWWRLKFCEL
jgi:hypothetical protein